MAAWGKEEGTVQGTVLLAFQVVAGQPQADNLDMELLGRQVPSPVAGDREREPL